MSDNLDHSSRRHEEDGQQEQVIDDLFDEGSHEEIIEEDLKGDSSFNQQQSRDGPSSPIPSQTTHSTQSFTFELALPSPTRVSPLNLNESVTGFNHDLLPQVPGLQTSDDNDNDEKQLEDTSSHRRGDEEDDERPARSSSHDDVGSKRATRRRSKSRERKRHSTGNSSSSGERRSGRRTEYVSKVGTGSRQPRSTNHKSTPLTTHDEMEESYHNSFSELASAGAKRLSELSAASPSKNQRSALDISSSNGSSSNNHFIKSPSERRNRTRSSSKSRNRSKSRTRSSSKEPSRPLRRAERGSSSRTHRSIDDESPVVAMKRRLSEGGFLQSSPSGGHSISDNMNTNDLIQTFQDLGMKVRVVSRTSESPPDVNEGDDRECTSCGAMVPTSNNFCGGCGAQVTIQMDVECSSCGAIIPASDNFCGGCGTRKPGAVPQSPAKKRSTSRERTRRERGGGEASAHDSRRKSKSKWDGLRSGMEFINEAKNRVERNKQSSSDPAKSSEDITADFLRRAKIAKEKKKKRQGDSSSSPRNGNAAAGGLVQPRLSLDKLDLVRQKLVDKVKEDATNDAEATAGADPNLQESFASKETSSSRRRSKNADSDGDSRSRRSRSKSKERTRNRSKSRERSRHSGEMGGSGHRSRSKSRERKSSGREDGGRRRRKKSSKLHYVANSVKTGMEFINEAKSRVEKSKRSPTQGDTPKASDEDVTADFFRRAKLAAEKKKKRMEQANASKPTDNGSESTNVADKPVINLVQPKLSHDKLDIVRQKLMGKVQAGEESQDQSSDTEGKTQSKWGALKANNLIAASKGISAESSSTHSEDIAFDADFSKIPSDASKEAGNETDTDIEKAQSTKWGALKANNLIAVSKGITTESSSSTHSEDVAFNADFSKMPSDVSKEAGNEAGTGIDKSQSKWGALKVNNLIAASKSMTVESSSTHSEDVAFDADFSKMPSDVSKAGGIEDKIGTPTPSQWTNLRASLQQANIEDFHSSSDEEDNAGSGGKKVSDNSSADGDMNDAAKLKSPSQSGSKWSALKGQGLENLVKSSKSPELQLKGLAAFKSPSRDRNKDSSGASKWESLKGANDFINATKKRSTNRRRARRESSGDSVDAKETSNSAGEAAALKFLAKAKNKSENAEGSTEETPTRAQQRISNWDNVRNAISPIQSPTPAQNTTEKTKERKSRRSSKWGALKGGIDFINKTKSKADKNKSKKKTDAEITEDFLKRQKIAKEKKRKEREKAGVTVDTTTTTTASSSAATISTNGTASESKIPSAVDSSPSLSKWDFIKNMTNNNSS